MCSVYDDIPIYRFYGDKLTFYVFTLDFIKNYLFFIFVLAIFSIVS